MSNEDQLTIHDVVDDLVINSSGGMLPFEADGTIAGFPFYFRERGGDASLQVWDRCETITWNELPDNPPNWTSRMRVPQVRDTSARWLDTFVNLIATLEPNEIGVYRFSYMPARVDYDTWTCWMDERVEAFQKALTNASMNGESEDLDEAIANFTRLFAEGRAKTWHIVRAYSIEEARAKSQEPKDHRFLLSRGFPLHFLERCDEIERNLMSCDPEVDIEPRVGQIGPFPGKLTIPDTWKTPDKISPLLDRPSLGEIHTRWRGTREDVRFEWLDDLWLERHGVIMRKVHVIAGERKRRNTLEGANTWSMRHENQADVQALIDFATNECVTLRIQTSAHIGTNAALARINALRLPLETLARYAIEDGKETLSATEAMMVLLDDPRPTRK